MGGVSWACGARLLCELADGLGLSGLSAALAPTRRRRGHDRGRVLTDLAVAIADGASAISDRRVLAISPICSANRLRGHGVAGAGAVDQDALSASPGSGPGARGGAGGRGRSGLVCHRYPRRSVEADSDKQHAAPTYKHGFGFYPLGLSSVLCK